VSKINYRLIKCKSLLHRLGSEYLPFRWHINPYRGCSHSCVYCYARYSHEYLGYTDWRDFEQEILVKTNAAAVLRAELRRRSWRGELVNLSGVCDPYQPAEGQYRITQGILEALRDQATPACIATKSPLVLRDADIIEELNERAGAAVLTSICTLDTDLARLLEPDAPPPERRLEIVAEMARRGVPTGILLMPVLPFLTDSAQELEALAKAVRQAGGTILIAGGLNLRSSARRRFIPFLAETFPDLLPRYRRLYSTPDALSEHYRPAWKKVEELRAAYGLSQDIDFPGPRPAQLRLWEEVSL
jgi:DNA repair photolyase